MNDLAARLLFATEEAHTQTPSFHPRIAAAQAVLESGDPPSILAMKYANCLGIKAGQSWSGPSVNLSTGEETAAGEPYSITAAFRVYGSWAECFLDYARIMDLPWYADAKRDAEDPVAFLLGLITPGEPSYATDSRYVEKVLRVAYSTGLLPLGGRERLGRHELVVDNSPTLASAWETAIAALQSRAAVHRSPVLVTRTRRPDGSWKLDLRAS